MIQTEKYATYPAKPPQIFGLIGYPLEHSFSPAFFNEKFYKEDFRDANYELFPLEKISDFPTILKQNLDLKGLNVTIPYKTTIIPYLDNIDPVAQQIGAVNTIKISNTGQLMGYNTDIYGIEKSLQDLWKNSNSKPKKALILGTGGGAKSVSYVLNKKDIITTLVSRQAQKGQLTYADIDENIMANHQLIVNTTPVGMYPNDKGFPDIPYSFVGNQHLFFDLVYRPEKTIFMIKGKLQGATVKGGLDMLYWQAEKSWEIWQDEGK